MIEKIGINLNYNKKLNSNSQQKLENVSNSIRESKPHNYPKLSSELLQNYYVSFGASKKETVDKNAVILNNLNDPAYELLSNAQNIAKKYGHNEVDRLHVLKAGLEYVDKYIDKLNSGEINYKDYISYDTHMYFEQDMGKDVFKDKAKRNLVQPVIKEEIKFLDEKLAETSVNKSKNNGKNNNKNNFQNLPISKQFLNDVYSVYIQDNGSEIDGEMLGDGLVHDNTLFSAAIMPNNDTLQREITKPFRNKLKDALYIDKRTLEQRPHLKFYDDKAKNIWKNLAIGTNMMLLKDKGNNPGYFVNSFLHIFDQSEKGFGNLSKANTKILNLNSEGFIDDGYTSSKLDEFGKDKDNNYIVIMDIMDKDINKLDISESNVEIFKTAPKNVKFVMVADKNEYYKEMDEPGLGGFFSTFGEVTVPLMNQEQAQKMFLEVPELTSKITKTFSKPAIKKCVEVANQLTGNYPEKAQRVMDLVASYYVDKQNIGLNDVQNYVKEAKGIFKPVENDTSIKLEFDTGIKLKDMVGSPSTKKEAQSIVQRIKSKTMGTKGYVIYSQDGSVGAGRKYTAQAIAGELKIPYIEINAVDFGTKDVDLFGGGNLSPEASMKKLFSQIKTYAESNPKKSAVLFVENFEFFSYGENLSEYHEKAMSQLIREMDKAQEQGLNIIVFGSMNNPQYIGQATSKSFKFINQIEVESPGYNKEARAEIVDYYIKKRGIKLNGDLQEQENIKKHISLMTERASYIEILMLLDKVVDVAKERKHKKIEKSDFTEAFLQLNSGRPAGAKDPDYRKELVTSHECGHALNAYVMEALVKKVGNPRHQGPFLNFITLDPRGSFGGAVYTADMINPEMSFENVFSDIICFFGGTSCEKHFYNQDGSWGITSDMAAATSLATQATSIMGQGKHFGKKSLDGMHFLSEKDKDTMNKDIDVILNNARIISEAITEIYSGFNKVFVDKYAKKVGTGECIVHREEFLELFEKWKSEQTVEKQKEFELLDEAILKVIDATKKGIACSKE